jgi:hypothetical protein
LVEVSSAVAQSVHIVADFAATAGCAGDRGSRLGERCQTNGPGSGHRGAAVHIDNFGRVNEHYYRGAQPTGQDFADLAKLGVKATIDLTNGDDEDDANSNWLRAPG